MVFRELFKEVIFKTAQNILNTLTKEIKIKTNDGTDSELFRMAYLHFSSHFEH